MVSISAARAASTVAIQLGEPVEFDGRVWVGSREQDVVDYFRWRQEDAGRCALNTTCYWTLRKAGKSVRDATKALEKKTLSEKHELLFAHGITFAEGRGNTARSCPRGSVAAPVSIGSATRKRASIRRRMRP